MTHPFQGKAAATWREAGLVPGQPPAGPGLTSSSRAAQGAGLRIVAGESRGLSFSPGHGDVSPLLGPLHPSEFALHLLCLPFILREAGCFCAMCIILYVSPDDYEHPVTRDSQNVVPRPAASVPLRNSIETQIHRPPNPDLLNLKLWRGTSNLF